MISSWPFRKRFAPRVLAGPLHEESDAALALAGRGRDRAAKEAFVEIVRRHQTAVGAVAYGVTGSLDLTEDIVQETFLYAWNHMSALRDPARLKAWLARIARSKALDVVRSEGRSGPMGDNAAEIPAPEIAPDAAAADAEDEMLVWRALAELPESYRVPLALFYNEGQSVAAVAETLEISQDAVKQRLSRGREALRAKVAAQMAIHAESKLSGVLRRVQPGPLLIVSIATAIGLFAAPAAIAAAVFTASGTVATAGSAASASTVSTAMTACSYLVATITLCAFIPLGWHAREPDTQPAALVPLASQNVSIPNLPVEFTGSALLKEWKRLHDTHGSDASAMPVIYAEIDREKNAFRRRALRSALISEWGGVDPAGAFAFLHHDRKQDEQTTLLMHEWLARDPAAAARHLASETEKASSLARALLVDVAAVAPAELAEIVRRLPASDKPWDQQVSKAFAAYALKDSDAAREAAFGLSGVSGRQALAGVAEGWAQKDGAATLAWAKTLPEGTERDDSLRATLVGWARADPASALAHFDAAPAIQNAEDPRSSTAVMVLQAAAERDFEAAVRALEKHQAKLGLNAWEGLADALQRRLEKDSAATMSWLAAQPESLSHSLKQAFDHVMTNHGYPLKDEIWAWLESQEVSAFTDKLKSGLVMTTANKDPEEAVRLLSGMEDNKALRFAMSRQVHDLITTGHSPEQIDAFIAKLPESWRSETMAAAYSMSRGFLTGDLTPWIQRLEFLPPPKRPSAAASLAERMAAADPEAAIRWAGSLGDANMKAGAIRGGVHAWAGADSYEASAWVVSLPPGMERDVAAAALAGTIARGDPESAWIWAASVSHSEKRINALGQTLATIHEVDPQRARFLLREGKLPPEDRLRLEEFVAADPRFSSPAPSASGEPAAR